MYRRIVTQDGVTVMNKELYDNLQDGIDELKSGQFLEVVGSKAVMCDSSKKGGLRFNKIFGRSEQVSTTGKNLLENTATTKTVSGVAFTVNDDGSVTISGTATANADFYCNGGWNNAQNILGVNEGTYIVSGTGDANIQLYIIKSSTVIYSASDKDITMSVADGGINAVLYRVPAGKTVNKTVYPMIRLASITDSTYEPYTGGQPSPSPDYPQPIESVGDDGSVDVGVYGKNLLNNKNTTETINGVTFTVNKDKSVTVNGTATGSNAEFSIVYDANVNGDYILSGCPNGGSLSSYYINVLDTTTWGSPAKDFGSGATLSLIDGRRYHVRVLIVKDKTVSNLSFCPMIRIASITDGTYEPYTKQSLITSTLNGLPAIKVADASLATYTDENGVMWCADEVDFARGKYVQRVLCDRVSSALNWTYSSSTNRFYANDTRYRKASNSELQETYCNGEYLNTHFKNNIASSISGLPNMSISYINGSQSGYSYKYLALNGDVDAWKAFLDENEVYTLGILATPIETDLTAEEMEQFLSATTNDGVTTILTDSIIEPEISVSYGKTENTASTLLAENLSKKNSLIQRKVLSNLYVRD